MAISPIEVAEEFTGLNDEGIANILGVSRQTVISYKNGSTNITFDKLTVLSQQTGISLDVLCGNTRNSEPPTLKKCYSEFTEAIFAALRSGSEELEKIKEHEFGNEFAQVASTREQTISDIENVLLTARAQAKKPTVGVVGVSDAGKSTFINYLLGSNIDPASYGPLTSASTYFMDAAERPKPLTNPLENAIVLGRRKDSGLEPFSLHRLDDEEYVQRYCLTKGNAESILNDYGTRDGAFFKDDSIIIDAVIVFLDSPILAEVTLADFPGFNTGEEKDDISLMLDASQFDILFFLSKANGFFSSQNEVNAFAHFLQGREDMTSIFALATYANFIGKPSALNDIMDGACDRLIQVLPDNTCARIGITAEDHATLRSRFFGFAPQTELYCKKLNKEIESTFYNVGKKKLRSAEEFFYSAVEERSKKMSDAIKNLDELYSEGAKPVSDEEVKAALSHMDAMFEDHKKYLRSVIMECRDNHKLGFRKKYDEIINEKYIVDAIERKGFKNRGNDMKALGNYISQELSDAYKSTCESNSREFSTSLDKTLDSYRDSWGELKFKIPMMDFDFKRAFISGLVGLTTFGALAFWASIVAGGSNLGAYILIAKLASILATLGIHVGGASAVIGFVSAIGGPLTLGIALSLIAAATAFGILSGKWKSRAAKKIISAFEQNNALDQYISNIDSYWNETDEALGLALDTMHEKAKRAYRQKAADSRMDYEGKIKLKTILSMWYDQVKNVYDKMADIIKTMRQTVGEHE